MALLTMLLGAAALFSLLLAINPRYRRGAILSLVFYGGLYLVGAAGFRAANEPQAEPRVAAAGPAAPAPMLAPSKPQHPGIAHVCLGEDGPALNKDADLVLPRSAVFEDEGPNTGKPDEPTTWHYEEEGALARAAFETLADATLTQKSRCADVPVAMLTSSQWPATRGTADDHHVFVMEDVLDYSVPAKRPPVEVGKLIDDLSVLAIITSDVTQSRPEPQRASVYAKDGPAACRAGARKLAAATGVALGTQTHMVVPLKTASANEASYGCATGARQPP